MNLRITGVQRCFGEKSKKSGKPYDFCVLHTLACNPVETETPNYTMRGYRCESLMCDTSLALDVPVPCLADVHFDRFGRVEGIDILEIYEAV